MHDYRPGPYKLLTYDTGLLSEELERGISALAASYVLAAAQHHHGTIPTDDSLSIGTWSVDSFATCRHHYLPLSCESLPSVIHSPQKMGGDPYSTIDPMALPSAPTACSYSFHYFSSVLASSSCQLMAKKIKVLSKHRSYTASLSMTVTCLLKIPLGSDLSGLYGTQSQPPVLQTPSVTAIS